MDLIFDIYRKLKNHEKRLIRNYFRASPFEFEKVGALYELVTRYIDKEQDEEFYALELYGKKPNNTFRVTKSRLKRLLEDAILSDKSLNEYDAAYINALLQSQKRLMQGEILLGRGSYGASKNLLQQVVSQARKFSLHREHFQAELLLMRSQSVTMSSREFQKRSARIIDLNRVHYLVNEAAILQYSLTNLLTHKTITDKAALDDIAAKLRRIEEIADETGSPVARYHYLIIHILFAQYEQRYKDAVGFCKAYLELLKTEPAVHSRQRLGSAYFQLTEVSLRSHDLDQAAGYVRETLAFFGPEETNYLIVLGSAFRIAFYRGDLDKAEAYLNEALSHPRFASSEMRAARWHYYRSCLRFRQGQVREALLALNDATALLRDKLGWNLSFRLIEIMILFEAGHFDLLESKILNLRQFVKRTQKNKENFRPSTLVNILIEWQKQSLDLKKTYPLIKSELDSLRKFHDDVPFDTSSGELIRLENWLEEKMEKKG